MGREKGVLALGGEPLIVRTSRMVQPLVVDLTVIGPSKHFETLGLRAIADGDFAKQEGKEPLQTPLVGIATALNATKSPWNLILACDLPYLTAEWLDWLLARAEKSGAQIAIPRTARGLEPLAAVYRKECAAPIVAALDRGILKVTDAIAELGMECLCESDWKKLDPHNQVLRNMNTQADYEEAREWWNSGRMQEGSE